MHIFNIKQWITHTLQLPKDCAQVGGLYIHISQNIYCSMHCVSCAMQYERSIYSNCDLQQDTTNSILRSLNTSQFFSNAINHIIIAAWYFPYFPFCYLKNIDLTLCNVRNLLRVKKNKLNQPENRKICLVKINFFRKCWFAFFESGNVLCI